MHPPIHHHLMQARTGCPDHQARRDALARATRRARQHQPGHRVPRLQAVAACRVLTVAGARSRRPLS